jgi:hypothetical protein
MIGFTPRPLYSRERAPSTHWIGSSVATRFGLVFEEKSIFLAVQPLARPDTDCDIPTVRSSSSFSFFSYLLFQVLWPVSHQN